jgi:small-conductance mechanosensitive channel
MLRAVANWMSTVLGRPAERAPDSVLVRVGVSYRSDPDQVRAILERVAGECALLRKEPRPAVSFDDFGPSALEFTLTARTLSGDGARAAESDLRTRILKAFRAAGIEMPFAQHDIHLRDLDAVRAILTRIAEERGAKPAPGPESKLRPGLAGAPRRDAG